MGKVEKEDDFEAVMRVAARVNARIERTGHTPDMSRLSTWAPFTVEEREALVRSRERARDRIVDDPDGEEG
jgi:hypothetical protein